MRHSTGYRSRRDQRASCPQQSRHLRRLRLEPLEDRRLLALYVDVDAAGGGTGANWTDAYPDLQAALAASEALNTDGDSTNDVDAIWIADGTYRPTAQLESGDARSASFSLLNGVSLLGGFAGGETASADRVMVDGAFLNETILSGDLGTIDDNSDNAYTVVYCDSSVEAAVDGVSIIGGNANGSYNSSHFERRNGGGLYNHEGTLTLTNSTLSGNSAGYYGGGISNSGTLTLANSTLSGNSVGNYGGGVYNSHSDTLTLTNSTLSGNSAGYYGGGIFNYGTSTLTNSTISGNLSGHYGGGIYSSSADTLTLTNSIVARNRSEQDHDDIYGSYTNRSSLVGVDLEFVRNPSDGGDGWVDDPATSGIDESANNDYGDLRLAPSSMAINLGDASLLPPDVLDLDQDADTSELLPVDQDGNTRVADGAVDLGAFEYQGVSSSFETPSTVVTTLSDTVDRADGLISLREAIVYATLGKMATPVTFDASLANGTISLNGTELWLDADVRIDAGAVGGVTLDAGGQSRNIIVYGEASVDLASLRIQGGTAEYGGGIYNEDGTLTLTNSTLLNNTAIDGGGIYNYGTLTLTNSTLSGNAADVWGGAIYNDGTLTLTNSTLSDNSADDNGGAIYNYHDGVLTLTNSTLSGNSAYFGGGIWNESYMSPLTLTNSILSGNSANEGGGAIYNDGTLALINSTLSGNSATYGGGICNDYDTLTLTNSIVAGNWAEKESNDIFGPYTNRSSLIGVEPGFVRNPSDGGDGWADDPATTGTDESANNDYGDLRLIPSSLAIDMGDASLLPPDAFDLDQDTDTSEALPWDLQENARVANGAVDLGAFEFQGAAARESMSTMVTTLSDTVDGTDGLISLREAIVYATLGKLTTSVTFDVSLADGTIPLNGTELWLDTDVRIDAAAAGSVTLDAGGQSRVLGIRAEASVDLVSLHITGGTAAWGGGGIYNDYYGTLTLADSTLSDNSTDDDGGGIYNQSGTLTLTNSALSDNSAADEGGAIYNTNSTLTLTNSTLSGNAANEGGGIYSSYGTLTLTNLTLLDNSAADGGGGIYNNYFGTLTLANSTLSGNTANDGGGIYNGYASTAVLTNSTLSGNSAATSGGGLYNRNTVTVTNSIVARNQAETGDNEVSGSYTNQSSLIGGDPAFARNPSDGGDGWGDDPATTGIDESANDDYGDLRLTPSSAAVNAGDASLLPPDTLDLDNDGDVSEPLPVDLHGVLRVIDGAVDQGAFEFQGPPGVTVTPTAGLVTTEAGGTATFDIVLDTEPLADVTIDLSSDDTSEGTIALSAVTFTPADWDTPQTVTVTGVDDFLDDDDATYTILTAAAVSTAPNYAGLDADDVAMTNTDDDTAGITVTPTTGLATTEAGGTATFDIVLDTEPLADVTIDLSSDDTSEGTIALSAVTFTPADWDTPQTVTVTGVDDFLDDDDATYSILTAAAVSTDPNYAGLDAADVAMTNTDDDTAGITVTPTAGLATTEAGGTATFDIVLDTEPLADVTIDLSSDDTSEGTIALSAVTFTPADWDTPQTVTVTGVDDFLDDDDATYSILTAAAVSTDPNYAGLDAADVAMTNTDDDTAGITVTPTAGLVTTEAGGTATFDTVLDTEPLADVTIDLSSDDTSEGTIALSAVTFTPADWDTPQTVTVTGVDDFLDDDDATYTILTAAAVSTAPNYAGLDADDVAMTNTDDDTAGITVTPTTGLATTEAGGTATFDIVLDTEPLADVTIDLSSDDTSEGTIALSAVTFTPADWDTPQTVTVTGVDDFLDDDDATYTILTAAAVSTDPNYAGLDADDVAMTNTDDDTAGITVTPTTGLATTEAGGTAVFDIVLDTEPLADVTIDLSSDDTSEGTAALSAVTFTPADWDTPQTVTVTGVDDTVADGDATYTILTAAAVSTDPNYAGLDADDVAVTNTDDDNRALLDLAIVAEPTTFDRPAIGESAALPDGSAWIDEWSLFYAEIWVSTPNGQTVGVTGGSLDLTYNTEHFSPTAVEFGPAFDQSQTETIDDTNGTISLAGSTSLSDVGDDEYALLARVRFETTASDADVTHNADGTYILPVQEPFDIGNPRIELVGSELAAVELGDIQEATVWPMMYDLDDSGRVDFGDLAYFASAFQQTVNDPGADYAYAADFDRSGKVDFGDLAYFAANFLRETGDGLGPLVYTSNFPAAWQPAPLTLDTTIAPRHAGESLTKKQLVSVTQAAVDRVDSMIGDEQTAAILHDIRFEIVDLPDNLLGRAIGRSTIQIDHDAAGHGWFVDTTPWSDQEFSQYAAELSLSAIPDTEASTRVDLLTTVMHELNHVLGFDHSGENDLMAATLPLGTRRLWTGEFDPFVEDFEKDRGADISSTKAVDEVFAQL